MNGLTYSSFDLIIKIKSQTKNVTHVYIEGLVEVSTTEKKKVSLSFLLVKGKFIFYTKNWT